MCYFEYLAFINSNFFIKKYLQKIFFFVDDVKYVMISSPKYTKISLFMNILMFLPQFIIPDDSRNNKT